MVKIGLNCQLPLSEIGLTSDSEGTGVTSLFHFHSRVLMCFHAPLRPRKMDKFLFLGTHTRCVTTKRIMVTPPLTTSFMNFILIEIHVLPRQNLELAILLPSRQRFTSVERMIHSDRHESPTTLHCQNPCCIFERGWPPCFSHRTILFPTSLPSPRSTETKCRAGANSSSRTKGLTEPGSLTNTNRIEKNCLFCILSPVPLLPRALRNRSDEIDIPST